MSTGEAPTKPISVKIIETQYVETDATSFKSVVQRLTGKGAAPPSTTTVGSGSTGRRLEAREEKDADRDRQRRSSDGGGSKGEEIVVGVPTLDELSKLLGG